MTAADRLYNAAAVLHDGGAVAARQSTAFALALSEWLDEIAADKDAGAGCIHPRALDLANLILGDTPKPPRERWRFTGRRQVPIVGDALTWELTDLPVTDHYAIAPEDFWSVTP